MGGDAAGGRARTSASGCRRRRMGRPRWIRAGPRAPAPSLERRIRPVAPFDRGRHVRGPARGDPAGRHRPRRHAVSGDAGHAPPRRRGHRAVPAGSGAARLRARLRDGPAAPARLR
jgi:hypothetical protein